MPTRMLRDWTDSPKFDGLSADAERLFVRLIMKADDFGRFHADPRLVNSLCFPMGDRKVADTSRNFRELESRRLVVVYEVGGRDYMAVVNYRQRLKQSRAKFPQMPNKPEDWLAMDDDFREVPGTSGLNPNPKTISNTKEKAKGDARGGESRQPEVAAARRIGFRAWDAAKLADEVKAANADGLLTDQECADFCGYWTEPSPTGRLRLWMERTWDTRRRMQTALRVIYSRQRGSSGGQQGQQQDRDAAKRREWKAAYLGTADLVWRAKETGGDVVRAMQAARDKYGDCPKLGDKDAVERGIALAGRQTREQARGAA